MGVEMARSGLVAQPVAGPSGPWRDAREWLERIEALGEIRTVTSANWQDDIGTITALLDRTDGSPAVMFDEIPGYPAGRRVLVNSNGTIARQAVTLNIPPDGANHDGILDFWRRALADAAALAPVEVSDGPVFEHVLEGDAIDLGAFPVPVWHPKDGGPYIGTASLNVLRDPDTGWVNAGTYRNQVFGRDSIGVFMSPGKHGKLIREKYFERGERCPIVVVAGADPLLFLAAAAPVPYGVDEFAWAGGVRRSPIEIVRGRHTGLPFPARAEVVIEGWMEPGDRHAEGPYGEFQGYYASGEGDAPVVRVVAIYHRDDPILLGCPQGKPPHEDNRALAYLRAAQIEAQLRAAGVPRVTGVWCPPETAERFLTVVAIDQAYAGHATQALTVAGQTGGAAYIARAAVVVDSDIDITNLTDVLWAIMTRCDPERDVTILRRAWSGPLDPAIHPDERGLNSRLLIDATKPWEWRDRFADPVVTADMTRAARERWGWILDPSAPDPRE
jgi:4-hydroxy-3-polyprenylbenzoate decarboxylase